MKRRAVWLVCTCLAACGREHAARVGTADRVRDTSASNLRQTDSATPAVTIPTQTGFSSTPSGTGVLSVQDVPAAALAALQRVFPTFAPFGTNAYSDSLRRSRNAVNGLVVISGHFQRPDATDYALAGHTADSVRVVALLAQADGSFRAVVVARGTPDDRADEVPPPLYIQRMACQPECPVEYPMMIGVFYRRPVAAKRHDITPLVFGWRKDRGAFFITSYY